MSQLENTNSEILYPQSAVIPFQFKKNRVKILLITSLKSKQWIIPKGIIENNTTPQQSALQEALEEAGVEGEVLNILLGEYSYAKWGGICEVKVFPMHVTKVLDDWPEANLRNRKWLSIDKAINLVSKEELRRILRQFETNAEKIRSVVTAKPNKGP